MTAESVCQTYTFLNRKCVAESRAAAAGNPAATEATDGSELGSVSLKLPTEFVVQARPGVYS